MPGMAYGLLQAWGRLSPAAYPVAICPWPFPVLRMLSWADVGCGLAQQGCFLLRLLLVYRLHALLAL